jgi:hypothetical protein
MRRLGELKGDVEKWRNLQSKVAELLQLAELAADDEESSLQGEIVAQGEGKTFLKGDGSWNRIVWMPRT